MVAIGRTTIVFYSQARRFDIDSDSGVCHIKCKLSKEYDEWSLALRKHRMYRLGSGWSHEESLDGMQKKGLRGRTSSAQNNALANWIVKTDYFVQVYICLLILLVYSRTSLIRTPTDGQTLIA